MFIACVGNKEVHRILWLSGPLLTCQLANAFPEPKEGGLILLIHVIFDDLLAALEQRSRRLNFLNKGIAYFGLIEHHLLFSEPFIPLVPLWRNVRRVRLDVWV